jgi:hypothetical protein
MVFEFFKRQVQVARVYGIPVRIDYRWFPVSLAILWLVAVNLPAVGVRAGVGRACGFEFRDDRDAVSFHLRSRTRARFDGTRRGD